MEDFYECQLFALRNILPGKKKGRKDSPIIVQLSIESRKLPFACVWVSKIGSKYRIDIPIAFMERYESRLIFRHIGYVITTYQKFFISYFLKGEAGKISMTSMTREIVILSVGRVFFSFSIDIKYESKCIK